MNVSEWRGTEWKIDNTNINIQNTNIYTHNNNNNNTM